MVTEGDVEGMIGAAVFDREHDRIGEVRQVYLDADSDLPTWVGVRTGLFGADVLVPLDGAEWAAPALHADVSRRTVRTAPPTDVDEPLSSAEQEALLRHYGIPGVRSPREPVDLEALCGAGLSYSVQDDGMDEDVERDGTEPTRTEPTGAGPTRTPPTGTEAAPDGSAPGAGTDGRGVGDAMREAATERSDAVSGRMLHRAPDVTGPSAD